MGVFARCVQLTLVPRSVYCTFTCSTCLVRQLPRGLLTSTHHHWSPWRQMRIFQTGVASFSNRATKQPSSPSSSDGHVVYRTHMTNYVYWLYAASASTTIFAAAITVISTCIADPKLNELGMVFVTAGSPIVMTVALMTLVVALLKMMHAILRRTVFRMNYREDTQVFTAFTYNWHLASRRTRFVAEDVSKRDVTGLSQLMGNYVINGRQYIVLEKDFISPVYFHLMTSHIK